MPDAGVSSEVIPPPIFITSLWRGGSSLLYALLNQHPDISLMYEADLPLLWPLFLPQKRNLDWSRRWDFWNQSVQRHGLASRGLPRNPDSAKRASESVYRDYARLRGAFIWGDKSPSYHTWLITLFRQFPDARFIIVWRGLRSVCASMAHASRTSSFFRKKGIFHRAILGNQRMKADSDDLRRRGARILEVHYEELVEDPRKVLTAVCMFLGVSFHPRMTSLSGADTSALFPGEHHSALRGEKILSQVDRRIVLAPSLERKIAGYLAHWRRTTGAWPAYPLPDPQPSPSRAWSLRLWDQAFYRLLNLFDNVVLLAFCFVPLAPLRFYRMCRDKLHSLAARNSPFLAPRPASRHQDPGPG
jgi:hypothetical protein